MLYIIAIATVLYVQYLCKLNTSTQFVDDNASIKVDADPELMARVFGTDCELFITDTDEHSESITEYQHGNLEADTYDTTFFSYVKSLTEYTIRELKAMAKDAKLKGYGNMTKTQLYTALIA